MWNTNIDDTIIRPIADKAITLFAEKVLAEGTLHTKINEYQVRMIRNNILDRDIFKKILCPEAADANYMINVEVGIPSGDMIRWFVGIYYSFKDGEWIEENKLKKLTTYGGKERR
jgi:hypothetical protein